jgi:hypothetical protein
MCNFFSFVTDPVHHPAEYYYFNWDYRKANLDDDGADSHSHICAHFRLDEDECNKYEFNPLTGSFVVDQNTSERDDSDAAEKWARRLDFKTVVEPLIIKPIVRPLNLPEVKKVTAEHIQWLSEWASVRDSVRDSVRASVRASVWNTVWNTVRASVWDTVWNTVRASVWDTVYAYLSSFFAVEYEHDFSCAIKLWEAGLVPSFDGKTWRLHTGKDAHVIYEEVVE